MVNRSEKYEMKEFVGVTDDDRCAFLARQPGIDEVNLAAKRDRMAGLTP